MFRHHYARTLPCIQNKWGELPWTSSGSKNYNKTGPLLKTTRSRNWVRWRQTWGGKWKVTSRTDKDQGKRSWLYIKSTKRVGRPNGSKYQEENKNNMNQILKKQKNNGNRPNNFGSTKTKDKVPVPLPEIEKHNTHLSSLCLTPTSWIITSVSNKENSTKCKLECISQKPQEQWDAKQWLKLFRKLTKMIGSRNTKRNTKKKQSTKKSKTYRPVCSN